MPRLFPGLVALCLALAPGLLRAGDAKSNYPQMAPMQRAPQTYPTALARPSGMAPPVIEGYAALVDPATGRRYVPRENGGTIQGLTLTAQFTRNSDGSLFPATACSWTCGQEVDDAGAAQYVNSSRTTAFRYVVIFQPDWSWPYDPQALTPHGEYHGVPITAVVTWNPGRYNFVGLQAGMLLHATSGRDANPAAPMSQRRPSFEDLPPF